MNVSPIAPTLNIRRGQNGEAVITVANTGTSSLTGITVTAPSHISWVSLLLDSRLQSNNTLAPGEQATFTLHANPDVLLTPGYYRDLVTVSAAGNQQTQVALTVHVTLPTRTLQLTVNNNQGQLVANATIGLIKQDPYVIVTEGQSQTYQFSTQTNADSSSTATFNGLEVGMYQYTLSAANHQNTNGTLTVVEGSGIQVLTVTMPALAALSLAPNVPVLTVLAGQSVAQPITIRNDGAAPLTNVRITTPTNVPWVYLGTPGIIPSIGAGGSSAFTLFANPPANVTGNIFQDYVTVNADGGLSAQVALTVKIAPSQTRDLQTLVTDGASHPIASGGTITLIQQTLTTQVIGGQTTTYHRQFSGALTNTGTTMFTGLEPGDYNYLISAAGYNQGNGTLSVSAGTGTQNVTISLLPDPFRYTWTVTPIQQAYDIKLTLTYDTLAGAGGGDPGADVDVCCH